LVVVEGMGKITWFSTATGRYGGVIHQSLATVDAVVSWDQSFILVFGGPGRNLDAVLNILDIQGNVLTSWFKEDTFDL